MDRRHQIDVFAQFEDIRFTCGQLTHVVTIETLNRSGQGTRCQGPFSITILGDNTSDLAGAEQAVCEQVVAYKLVADAAIIALQAHAAEVRKWLADNKADAQETTQ